MNDLAAPFRQLVERRLWPLALLLVIALVAVPLLLAKPGEDPADAPLASTATTAGQGETQPIVSVAEPGERESARKVLGDQKNPFRPAVTAKATPEPTASAPTTPATPGGGTSPPGGGTGGWTPGPVVPRPTFELHSLIVRFGNTSSGEPTLRNLKRLKGLPGGSSPKLVYLGLLRDHKTAVFLVAAGAAVRGDGRCEPAPKDCQTLRMRAGETAFIDVKDPESDVTRQYQLDLVKVITRKTTDPVVAAAARADVDKDGREALRAQSSRPYRYRYSTREGVLRVLSGREWKAAKAAASAAARDAAATSTPAPAS